MRTRKYSDRIGLISNKEVIFTVQVDFNNGVVSRAIGTFQSSRHYDEFSGTTSTLVDKETDLAFPIFVTKFHFTFKNTKGLEKF